MGANHSDSNSDHIRGETARGYKGGQYRKDNGFKAPKISSSGKPSPPSQPQSSDVTHNTLTLSWQPPRHNSSGTVIAYTVEMTNPQHPKAWVALTKCCQGNRFQVKNLKANTDYIFRVRAENIHGVSKGSRPSVAVTTSMYEMEQRVYDTVNSPSKSHSDESGGGGSGGNAGGGSSGSGGGNSNNNNNNRNAPRRRHSINLHLEGTVTSILNHTDIPVKTVSVSQSQSSQELDRSSDRLHGSSSKLNALQRDAALRSSLQPSRKRSLPILLPGTRTHSLSKLRDSQTLPNIRARAAAGEVSDSFIRRKEFGPRSRSASDAYSSSASGSREDCTDGRSCCSSSKDESYTDDDLKMGKRDSGNSLQEEDIEEEGEEGEGSENPWELGDEVKEVSDRIMAAPLCDDIKIALYSSSVPDCCALEKEGGVGGVGGMGRTSGYTLGRNEHILLGSPDGLDGFDGPADFRTLRSLLHSDDIIVKPLRSLPDLVTYGKLTPTNSLQRNINNNNYNKLTTIVDLEEEEEELRITTL